MADRDETRRRQAGGAWGGTRPRRGRRATVGCVAAIAALGSVIAAPAASVGAESPLLVADLDPRGRSSSPEGLTEVRGVLYFAATDPDHGPSLWRTDGTSEGTTFVHDAYPASTGEYFDHVGNLARRGTDLFFVTRRERETDDLCCRGHDTLWRSDGTPEGTVPLRTWLVRPDDPGLDLVVVGATVYLAARDRAHGLELWSSDGTRAGTRLVADLRPGPRSSAPSSLVAYRDQLWFAARDALWWSDGTARRTQKVTTLPGGPSRLAVAGDGLYLVTEDAESGAETLWSSDGTAAGTQVVIDTGPDGGWIGEPTAFDGRLAFVMCDDSHGCQLWITDGTSTGTRALTDLDTEASDQQWWLTVAGRTLYFLPSGSVRGHGLWRSDGTPEGTAKVFDPPPSTTNDDEEYGDPDPEPRLTAFGDRVFFFASASDSGPEPWLSDGTASGTHVMRDIWPGPSGSAPDQAMPVVVAGQVYFTAEDPQHGIELWTTDGTAAGTRMVHDVMPSGLGASVTGTAAFKGSLVFTRGSREQANGSVWQTDGTASGTIELSPPSTIHEPYGLGVAGGRLYVFHPDQVDNINRLITSDGTLAGTRVLDGWVDGDYAWCVPGEPLAGVFLAGCHSAPWLTYSTDDGEDPLDSGGLLRSDGTEAGTKYLLTFRDPSLALGKDPTPRAAMVTDIVRSSDEAFFLVQRTDLTGSPPRPTRVSAALWRTDGTKTGTRRVVSLDLGPTNQIARAGDRHPPRLLVAAPGRIHLLGRDAGHGIEPWVSDGTARGTRLLADVRPGRRGSNPSRMARVGRLVTFRADDGRHGPEPWVSDGSRRGTRLLRDVRPGSAGSGPSAAVAMGGRGYFAADDGVHGRELWVTDGSRAGTRMVRDIARGRAGSRPGALTMVGDRLYFAADDGASGRELWVTDGTADGTRPVADLWPGARGSRPTHLTAVAGTLYFVADDGVRGPEVWRLAD